MRENHGRQAWVRAALVAMLLSASCSGGDGTADDVFGIPTTFVPDRAPAEGEFFLVGGPVHDSKVDLELHVRWPAGKGSLAAVIVYLKLPSGLSPLDLRLGDGWPAWQGTPDLLLRGPNPANNQWILGLSAGVPRDDDGNDCIPFPEPVDGDLHLGTFTVQGNPFRVGHVDVIPIEEYDSGPNSWYCRELGVGYPILHASAVGGTFR